MSIPKEYLPDDVEERWSREWADAGLFVANPASGKQPFCMIMPPPNVTGNLHIGHVLVYTLHDITARWRRMQGRDVLWLPGTDHAGIATQMVVERELASEGVKRQDLGREKFEARVWEWKETYGGNITKALRQLGSSADWTRERFTLDEGLSAAVRQVFVQLYREELIYRDRYIVNWCPGCRTAISDLETVSLPVKGKLYTIRYPAADGDGEGVRVATTRPETMLGDSAVAVHPTDERFRESIGLKVEVPLTGRQVSILADELVDPEFGTGAVKLTPSHDPNDFAAGRRHGLEEIEVIDSKGQMTERAGEFAGLDRFEARKRVVARLDELGLLEQVKDHDQAVGHCQRCNTMIEPLVSTQWFVKIAPLAEPAIEAVEQGRIRFIPDSWSKTYFEWMRNIHDWCISRQLWWGHRIPAWYCDACSKVIVDVVDPTGCPDCSGDLRQDEDVLDTWFSSGLLPFTSLGWPERTQDLERYYPTQLLITGHDIIFFWVARMIMMGLKFGGEVPFAKVYIHGLVRDSQGQKMSKSKGNTVDPEELHGRYGTDAVRLTMAMLAAPGNDIPLAPERMEGYRAFANKLWNAFRFVMMRCGDAPPRPYDASRLTLVDRWILSRAQATVREVDQALETYRYDLAAHALYQFVWHQFCDWYIELVKPDLPQDSEDIPEDDSRSATARAVLLDVLGTLLRMLHPFMPFITEELWHRLPGSDGYLAVADWPESHPAERDENAEDRVAVLQELVARVRNLRAETRIDAGKKIRLILQVEDPAEAAWLGEEHPRIAGLVRAESIEQVDAIDPEMTAARAVVSGISLAIPLEGLVDLEAARARFDKDLEKVQRELAARTRKLSNQGFLDGAPAEVVARERELQEELIARRDRLQENLAILGGGDPGTE